MKTKYVLLLPVKWYQAVWTAEEAQTVHQRATTVLRYVHCLSCLWKALTLWGTISVYK